MRRKMRRYDEDGYQIASIVVEGSDYTVYLPINDLNGLFRSVAAALSSLEKEFKRTKTIAFKKPWNYKDDKFVAKLTKQYRDHKNGELQVRLSKVKKRSLSKKEVSDFFDGLDQ